MVREKKIQKTLWSTAVIMLFLVGVCTPVWVIGKAAEPNKVVMEQPEQYRMAGNVHGRSDTLQGAKEFMGIEIKNSQNESLGKVKDLIFDTTQNTVNYAILSVENKFYPVPWTALNTDLGAYTLDMTKSDFASAPGMASIDLQRLGSSEFRTRTQSFYSKQIASVGETGTIERAAGWVEEKYNKTFGAEENLHLVKCTDILGFKVHNLKNEPLAKLDNVVIDVREGAMAYGLVGYGGLLGMGEKTAAIPWASFTLQRDNSIAKLDATEEALQRAELNNGQLGNLTRPQFARQVHTVFTQKPYWEVFGFVAPEDWSPAAWQSNSVYNKNFNPAAITTFEGKVESVGMFRPDKNSTPGLRLKVRTPVGDSIIVQAGPQNYAAQRDLRFKTGSDIRVTGSKATIGEKTVIMASEIKMGQKMLTLRDKQGKPLWETSKPEQSQPQRTMEGRLSN
jgi:sporulation protein YlmC with PRC-barrel domain